MCPEAGRAGGQFNAHLPEGPAQPDSGTIFPADSGMTSECLHGYPPILGSAPWPRNPGDRECSGSTAGLQHPSVSRVGMVVELFGGQWGVCSHGWSSVPVWTLSPRTSASHNHAWAVFLMLCTPPTAPPAAGRASAGMQDTRGHAGLIPPPGDREQDFN